MLELIPERPALPRGHELELNVLVRLHPSVRDGDERGRPPLNLALVLDRSGSMEGEAWRLTVQAAHMAASSLRDEDRLSLVLFNDRVEVMARQAGPLEIPEALKALSQTRARCARKRASAQRLELAFQRRCQTLGGGMDRPRFSCLLAVARAPNGQKTWRRDSTGHRPSSAWRPHLGLLTAVALAQFGELQGPGEKPVPTGATRLVAARTAL